MKTIGKILIAATLASLAFGCAAKGPQITTSTGMGEKETVYFAGLSFVGKFDDIKNNFPHSNNLISNELTKEGISLLRARFQDIVINAQPENFIVAKEGGQLKKAPTTGLIVSVTVAIDRERVSFIRLVDNECKIVTQVGGQIIAMDINSAALIATVPLDVIYVDVQPAYACGDMRVARNNVKKVLFEKFAEEFGKKFNKMQIKKAYNNRIKIGTVKLGEKSLKRINANEPNHEAFQARVAAVFATSLSDTNFVPIVPYSIDNAVGTIELDLEDGNKKLTLPTADYEINLEVQGYNVALSEPIGVERAASFVSYFNIQAATTESDKPFLNMDLVGTASTKTPRDMALEQLDVWTSLFDSIKVLADGFASNIYDPSSKWLKESTRQNADKKQIKAQLQKLAEILDKCR